MKKLIPAMILFLCSLLLIVCSTPESIYKSAHDLLSQGKYSEAAKKFESLGSYEDASTLAIYCEACALCESLNFEKGIALLEKLGDYRDCPMRITYYQARSADFFNLGTTEFERLERAKSIYSENPLYLDSMERIADLDIRIAKAKEDLYNAAVKDCEKGNYSDSLNTLNRLMKVNYKDSKNRYTYYGIRRDEANLSSSTNQDSFISVASDYLSMNGFLDSDERAAALYVKADKIVADKYAQIDSLIAEERYADAEKILSSFGAYGNSQVTAYYYAIAEKYFSNNNYDAAAAAYKNAGTYSDAKKQSEYNKLRFEEGELAGTNDPDKLAALIKKYTAMGNYLDCITRAEELNAKRMAILDSKFNTTLALVKVGDYITFGSYEQDNNTSNGMEKIEWLVLAKENNRLLVISRYALDCQPYNKKFTSVTWETCALRKWLNNNFLYTAFTSAEKAMIPTVTVVAHKNPNKITNPGNDTQDKIFLLSVTEAEEFFSYNNLRQCKLTAYAKEQGAYMNSGGFCWWWLRSGSPRAYAAGVDATGSIFSGGSRVDHTSAAIRPALWIDLNP